MNTNKGKDRLWLWFGLSRAGWLTIPRVLMHEMPDEWQDKMAALLEEYDNTFPNQPDINTCVLITKNGRGTKAYNWLLDYRYPAKGKINSLKNVDPKPNSN